MSLKIPPSTERTFTYDRHYCSDSKQSSSARNILSRAIVATGVTIAGLPILHLWSPHLASPLPSDKKKARDIEARAKSLALQAGLSEPRVIVHLSLPYGPLAGSMPNYANPARFIFSNIQHKITLHRKVIDNLSLPQVDCILAHELGHIAMGESNTGHLFARSGRDVSQLTPLDAHNIEYAADWFAVQLCGRQQMISVLDSDLQKRELPDRESSRYRTHPLNKERIENIMLSNETHLNFLGTKLAGINDLFADVRLSLKQPMPFTDEKLTYTGSLLIALLTSAAIYRLCVIKFGSRSPSAH